MAADERLDESLAIERLNIALKNQYRSALQYSIVAASLHGLEAQALGAKLTEFGDEELNGVRQLIEKIVSFDGEAHDRGGPHPLSPQCRRCPRLDHRVRAGGGRIPAGGDRADRP
jgi:hypothetical protein